MKFIATIKNKGFVFKPLVRKTFIDYLSEHEDDELEIVTRKQKKTVSRQLRGFYWTAWLSFIKGLDENFKKYSIDEIHSFLKHEFNGSDVYNPISKKESRIVKSAMSDTVKTQDAFMYMEKIRRWVAENYAQEMPDSQEFKALRDNHFETEPIEKVEYPEGEYDDKAFE